MKGRMRDAARHLQLALAGYRSDPAFLYNTLGWLHLEMDQPQLAVDSFEKALEQVINDGFSYSGLVVAYDALDQSDKAALIWKALTALLANSIACRFK